MDHICAEVYWNTLNEEMWALLNTNSSALAMFITIDLNDVFAFLHIRQVELDSRTSDNALLI